MSDNQKPQEKKRPQIRNFYAASKDLSMGACQWSFNSKDAAVYIKVAAQTAYHADRRAKGEYDWKNAVNIKFDVGEVGGMIRALRTDGEFKFLHDFNGNKTSGNISAFTSKTGNKGFGINVTAGERSFRIPIPVGDAEFLMEFLRFALDHIFSADYAAEKKFWDERAKNKPEVSTTVQNVESDAPANSTAPDDDCPF